MTVLTHDAILKEIKKGNIKISPFDESQVGPGSIDLHLGDEFRMFKNVRKIVHVNDKIEPTDYTKVVKVKDYLLLKPGEAVMGITKEKITLAPDLCGWFEGRSRFARIGLLVHISASFIQPGISNRQVLEMSNMSHMTLAIYPGTALCQMVIERAEGKATYKGRYSDQKKV
jgi:dCTP deaminase